MKIVTPEEKKFIEYKIGLSGSFMTALYEAYFRADSQNRQKLQTAFPELEVAYHYSNTPNYWIDLLDRYNQEFNQ